MKLSPAGETFIKQWETCKLSAYLDQKRVWTIGWGHTGPDVKMGTFWTQQKADATFYLDVAFREEAVNELVTVELSQNQYDALVSFVYNCGVQAFSDSTLLEMLNIGDYANASRQFSHWNHVNGGINAGLTNRRAAEEHLFSTDIKFEAPPCQSQPSPPRQSLAQFLKSIFSGFFTSR